MQDWLPIVATLQLAERELLLFAACWFTVGLIDELAIDVLWVVFRLRGRITTDRLPHGYGAAPLDRPIAVFVPAWREEHVIATTLRELLSAWPQSRLRVYVGVYCNDQATMAAVLSAAGDPRLRIAVVDHPGPTTKADCLNRLYRALANDERREGAPFGAVVLQDAEDLVHPAGLQALAEALSTVDFAQLPVRAEPVAKSPWVAGHYLDEFAESHAKALPVRGALGAALPAAGVGCGFARSALARLTEVRRGQGGPFRPASLTEDYELGLTLSRSGRGARFLRLRDASGNLVATRSCFPASFKASARQKGRWVHGIALQGWDQLGWLTSPVEIWMAFRDRRAPLTALVLACAYFLLAIEIVLNIARHFGVPGMLPPHPAVAMLAWFSMVAFGWRAGVRVISTTHEYGLREGLLSLPRIPVSNAIAITATARAMWAYACSFGRSGPRWDKTAHVDHPALGSDEA